MRLPSNESVGVVMVEFMKAQHQHGPLRPGADRWSRLIAEEWGEAEDELHTLHMFQTERLASGDEPEVRKKVIMELAQLAQLCIGVIELLQAEEAAHGKG